MAGVRAGYLQPSSPLHSLTALFPYAPEKDVEARAGARGLVQAAGLLCCW